ncbi:fimbrial protein [Serratia quinivorans]|uniref:fimbrial protein n=1 Tax=Serratia quinivorans TaxID=137545 RepID=UPI002178DF11|nr:fimbrial protein [Serratia quinivorans]CAI0697350.1 putative minor fimbrial subunit StfF [Serratia quinivorans]
MNGRGITTCAGLLLMWVGGTACAAENMKLYGTLVEPPPCTINDGGMVDVDFGNRVGVKKVDGVNYLQPINYQITCDPNANSWNMTLEIVGASTNYDKAAVVTDATDLGIQILQNGQPFELNKPIAIRLASKPKLEAVPVKRPGAQLKEGPFEATATLLAVYQ